MFGLRELMTAAKEPTLVANDTSSERFFMGGWIGKGSLQTDPGQRSTCAPPPEESLLAECRAERINELTGCDMGSEGFNLGGQQEVLTEELGLF